MVTQVPSGELTSVEQLLVQHVCLGERLDLTAHDETVDDAAMRSWGDSRTCRASVIRDILRGRLAAYPDPHGLRLRGARIVGQLDLEHLTTDVHLELADCLLEAGVVARDARLASVDLAGCQVEHPADSPLDATRLTCSVFTLAGARITGHAEGSAVNLRSAHIGGNLDCDGAVLRNDCGPALDVGGVRVNQDVYLRAGFAATGAGDDGAVNLAGAHVGGTLDCSGAELRNDSGPALRADMLQVDQAMLLTRGFTATGAGADGAVWLSGAHIGGSFQCAGAILRNVSGPGLRAFRLQVDGDMYLIEGFTATGSGDRGAVRLTGARIGGNLDCSGAELRNDSGSALLAYGIQVGQDIYLTRKFTATSGGDREVINLRTTRVGGAFDFKPERLEHNDDPHNLLKVDGLTYTGVPGPKSGSAPKSGAEKTSGERWRELLQDGTPSYTAQPYQQLAAGYRALGNDRQARRTLIQQRDDQLARTHPHWSERLWGRITKITLGYGYQPWKALLFLAAVVFVSCMLAWLLGAHGALAQTDQTATPGRSCTVVQQVSVGLDLNLPVGTSVARVDCGLTRDSASVTAAYLSVVGWVLRLLAWIFAALFIAGFTSAVRKTLVLRAQSSSVAPFHWLYLDSHTLRAAASRIGRRVKMNRTGRACFLKAVVLRIHSRVHPQDS